MPTLSKQQKWKFINDAKCELNMVLSFFDKPVEQVTKNELLEVFEEMDRPFLYGIVKWAIKIHTGNFPTHEETLKASDKQEIYDDWVRIEMESEALYR